MAENNSDPVLESTTATPASNEALTFQEGADALTALLDGDLIGDDASEPASGSRPAGKTAAPNPEKPSVDDANFWDDEDDAANEDAEDAEEDEDEEGEEGEEGGTLALSDDTEIDLGDGQKAKLADLKADYGKVQERVKDMQRHFTQSMQKLGEEKEIVSTQAQRVIQHAQEVRAQRELIEAHAKLYMPAAPQRPQTSPQTDPIGWMEYQAQKEQYDEYMGSLNRIRQVEEQSKAREKQEQDAQMPKILAKQREMLLNRYPRLRNPELASKTMQDVVSTFQQVYGFPAEEVMQVKDARLIAAMLDATAFHRLKAKKPAVQKVIENKPKMMKSGRRMDAADQRKWGDKAKLKRLAETGSLDAAADVLADLI
jgi:hypothetical protein